jgi:hypothetical protein
MLELWMVGGSPMIVHQRMSTGERTAFGLLATVVVLLMAWMGVGGSDAAETSPDPMTSVTFTPITVAPAVPFVPQTVLMGADVPCYEDEALVVIEDRDPTHGLTWHCVSLESLQGEATAP